MNIKNLAFAAFISSFLLISCSRENKQGGLHYFNDFESVKGWSKMPIPTLVEGNAHSGNFSLKIDSLEGFSHAFNIKMKDISNKPIKKVRYSMYCMIKSLNAKASLVLAVDTVNKPNALWQGIPIQDQIKEINKWVKITGEVQLAQDGLNKPENNLVMYLWNNSKEVIFADDYELEFFE